VKSWKAATGRAVLYALAGVTCVVWGLALLGVPAAAMPYVAGIGGAFIAFCLSPAWLPPCRRRWQRHWQADEQERQRLWEQRMRAWRDNPPP